LRLDHRSLCADAGRQRLLSVARSWTQVSNPRLDVGRLKAAEA